MTLLRRISDERLRAVAGVVVAALLGLGAGAIIRGGGDHTAPTAAIAPATTATTVGGAEREEAVLTATAADAPAEVARGAVATVEFSTRPGSSCQLEVQPAQAPRDHERLPVRIAGADGAVAWRWNVADDVPTGDAQAVVVCSGGAVGQVTVRVV